MLAFLLEWEESPGVRDPVLAATWARLEIQAGEEALATRWPSRLVSDATNGIRRGVYGSVFPLAEWIVENWWFLLHEPCRVPEFPSGRRLAADRSQRAWVQRHNLLAARDGGALPDLTIYRDGEAVVVNWAPDPKETESSRPVRFIEEGEIRLPQCDIESALHRLVESVLERLADQPAADTDRLRSNWEAIGESRRTEADLCSWAASLGLDAYDENNLTKEIIELLQARASQLSADLRSDLLETSSRNSLSEDLDWLDQALDAIGRPEPATNGRQCLGSPLASAHQLGYEAARSFRQKFDFGLEPITDLSRQLRDDCGWPKDFEQSLQNPVLTNIAGLVGMTPEGEPRMIGPPFGHWASRFRLARSLYFLREPARQVPPRLITRAYTWDQRASRAFAAELLAPADALREVAPQPAVSADEIDRMARHFQVSPTLVEHQLTNHHIAWVDSF